MAQRFDPDRLETAGEAKPIAEQLMVGGAPQTRGGFAVSQSGVLVYQAGLTAKSALVWLDSNRAWSSGPWLSPERSAIFSSRPTSGMWQSAHEDDASRNRDVWLCDTARSAPSRLTFETSDDFSPVWSPDGDRLAFVGRQGGRSSPQSLRNCDRRQRRRETNARSRRRRDSDELVVRRPISVVPDSISRRRHHGPVYRRGTGLVICRIPDSPKDPHSSRPTAGGSRIAPTKPTEPKYT